MSKVVLPLLILFFGLPAISVGQERAAVDPLVGCYRIEIAQWEPPLLHPGNAKYQTPPRDFRLHAETGEGVFEQGRTIVRPLIPHGRTPSAYWHRTGSDSVRVIWTNGHAGVQLDLNGSTDVLRGTATALIDVFGPPVPEAEVVVRRTSCASSQK